MSRRPPAARLMILLVAMLVALVGVVIRLSELQVRGSDGYAEIGVAQRVRTETLPAERADIVDRNGVILAMSMDARDVVADPTLVTNPVSEAAAIAPVLGLRRRDVRDRLTGDGRFAYVDREVDRDVADRLAALDLPGIAFLDSTKRYYPGGALAPQVLGFVGVDGDGLAGMERGYDSLLAGTPGQRTIEVSAEGQPITGGVQVQTDPIEGSGLVLSIDRMLQYEAQIYLRRAVRENHAKGGTIVVMDPTTGDVLAMASYPWFDPNVIDASRSDAWRNRAVTDTWEPGSVNKIITAAAALESGTMGVHDTLRVPGVRDVDGAYIHDSHPHAPETMTLGDIIAESSNVGASLVADKVGNDILASTFARFGIGRPTGVGFPGEASGLVPPLSQWTDLTRATVSFGQGMSVSPLQMASVYATIANGGTWVQPRLVLGTQAPDGTVRSVGAAPTRRVVSEATAGILTRMLAYVVQDGTGEEAQIPGYQVAGKTGTAKKLDAHGHYTDRYVASFVGFLPAAAPRVVIATVIDEPRTIYGGIAAAPLFQHVARYAIQRLGIAPAPAVALPPHVLAMP